MESESLHESESLYELVTTAAVLGHSVFHDLAYPTTSAEDFCAEHMIKLILEDSD